jgi:hypothetical protein
VSIKYKLLIRVFIIISCFLGILFNMIVSGSNSTIPFLGIFNPYLYFTIQSNLLVLVWFTNAVICDHKKKTNFLQKPFYKGAITSYITLTSLVFFTILEPIYQIQGLHLISSVLLHYVVPIMVILDWVLYETRKTYYYRFLFQWMIYPISYAIGAIILAITIDKYLYPFFNIAQFGWFVLVYIVILSFVYLIIGITYITFNKKLSNHKNV